ncbi:hypothetical protein G3601_005372 [Salmonella enterica]|uniref:Pilus-related membrane protein n=1 Tax=Salmonella diarizonae TaxID=59204 RepID=A0A5Y1YE38_SALDZ|nr:hypothetical protein [Salmonella enterica]EBS3850705.1 hypothetical protein [Salmonella enterica subsp. enterica serovar Java]ECB2072187.1 hypothetical protein [Salmonella enterica subsp. enterica serovar Benin]ECC3917329.1 hypothetical protein [Salmonella enterica subsp. diarizonae]EDX3987268.1 hypothetical protein [Salmonella enterica subsp. enterica serovar 4,[5],12:b:-]EEE5613358.1 hypothetical protein [Salmonella enterica subsp. enterica serovar Typhimurium]EEE9947843.1 hypothetical p
MMLTEMMREHKLLTGVWWAPLPSTTHTQRTRAVRNLLERQYRAVTYDVATGDGPAELRETRKYRGLTEHHSSTREPLALYIRLLYGDGIYYSRTADGSLWLLIVSDGVIVPGTDCLLSPVVFDFLMEDRKFSQYKSLPVRELQEDCAEDILTHYQANQLRLKKRRYLFYGTLVCLGLLLLAIPTVFILMG